MGVSLMRVLIRKSDNLLIEEQSSATAGTLIQNALNYGFKETEVEEKEVTIEEFKLILDSQPKPKQPLTPSDRERLEALEAAMLDLIFKEESGNG